MVSGLTPIRELLIRCVIFDKLFHLMAEKQASDIFISAGTPIHIKIQGNTMPVNQQTMLPDMIEKIAQGKLGKFYKENTLVEQDFIKDSKQSVAQYVASASAGATVTGFRRVPIPAAARNNDQIKECLAACRKHGLKFGFYYSL